MNRLQLNHLFPICLLLFSISSKAQYISPSSFGSLFSIPGGGQSTSQITSNLNAQFYIKSILKSVHVTNTNSSITDWSIGGDSPLGGSGGSFYTNAEVPGGGAGFQGSSAAHGRIVIYW